MECGVPEWSASNIQKFNSENGEFVNNQMALNAAVMGVQDALFMNNILKSLGLKVKLCKLASIDNGRTVDIGNNWSVGHRTFHVKVKQNFLRELKEAGIVKFQWISTESS